MVDVIGEEQDGQRGKCEDCVWFKRTGVIEGTGTCHAMPPSVIMVPLKTLAGVEMTLQATFPHVTQDTFCGYFESDEQAIH